MNRAVLEWMFPLLREAEKMLLSCQRASCIDDYFHSPFPHLVSWTAQRSSRRCELSKRSKEVQWDRGRPKLLPHTSIGLPVCLAERDIFLWLNRVWGGLKSVCEWWIIQAGGEWDQFLVCRGRLATGGPWQMEALQPDATQTQENIRCHLITHFIAFSTSNVTFSDWNNRGNSKTTAIVAFL